MNKSALDLDIWVTPQDCLGVPGFPTAIPNIRKRLNSLADEHPELRRKRLGSKAYEYHVSLLPEEVMRHFGADISVIKNSRKAKKGFINNELNNNKNIWTIIFDSLTPEQQDAAIKIFINGGLNALLPAVVQVDNGSAGKEILQQRDTDTHDDTVTATSPHSRQKAS
ncbi:DNA-binding protein [Rahnella contaminans]|uniref:DNA-binding protein n=1 Tax=Rahnella contaminans TaxID=2703882 RepID=UPI003C2E37C2